MGSGTLRKRLIPFIILSVLILFALYKLTIVNVNGKINTIFTNSYICSDIDADDDDLKNLSKLKNIENLTLHSASITNIDFVKNMNQLRSILVDSPKVCDYSPLEECSNLESVFIHATSITDLSDFKSNKELKLLHIDQCDMIEKLDDIKSLNQLRTLYLSGKNISDITAISELSDLISVTLYDTSITDLSPLLKCGKITFLDLCGNISLDNINDLYLLDQLEEVNLAYTSVNDFRPLLKIDSLKKVTLSNNNVDLSTLESLEEKGIEVVLI